jgi:hypothetical protein
MILWPNAQFCGARTTRKIRDIAVQVVVNLAVIFLRIAAGEIFRYRPVAAICPPRSIPIIPESKQKQDLGIAS